MASACVCSQYFTINDAGELCLIPGSTGLQQILYFNTPGNFQFNKADYPDAARIRVRVQGAGGGSAGANSLPSEAIVRPGGSAGGYSESLINVSALGATETIVVGAGGTAGTTNTSGGAGGASLFGGLVIANGGTGGHAIQISGTSADVSSGILGAAPGMGDLTIGGGSSGGAIRLNGTNGISGGGGDSQLGHGGRSIAFESAGTSPTGYGAGAGGGMSYSNPFLGGVGATGIVIVEILG